LDGFLVTNGEMTLVVDGGQRIVIMNKMNSDLRFNSQLAALTSVLSYLGFRWYLEYHVAVSGYVMPGPIAYDSFYPFSFAQELLRSHSWILFHNPFGSLDDRPHLFSGLATLLAILHEFWKGSRIHAFDLVFSTFFSGLSGWWFGQWVGRISRQGRLGTFFWTQAAILGGGLGYVLSFGLGIDGMEHKFLFGSYWGISWQNSSLSCWEIFYHAIFWWGMVGCARARPLQTVICAILLLFFHPFTMTIFGLYVGIYVFVTLLESKVIRKATLFMLVGVEGTVAIGVWLYSLYLPSASADGQFFLVSYRTSPFFVQTDALIAFLLPALIALAVCVLLVNRDDRERPGGFVARTSSIISAILLIGLGFSHGWLDLAVQPAHWLRVYPLAFFFGACSTFPMNLSTRMHKLVTIAATGFITLTIMDTCLSDVVITDDLLKESAPPAILDHDLGALADALSNLPSKKVIYLRLCDPKPHFYTSAVEYTLSALTSHELGFGHTYFTPDLVKRLHERLLCQDPGRELEKYLAGTDVVVVDRGLVQLVSTAPSAVFGRFAVFLPKD
jgi:hypothetical protein